MNFTRPMALSPKTSAIDFEAQLLDVVGVLPDGNALGTDGHSACIGSSAALDDDRS